MRYEVEQKFAVDDMPALEAKLAALGASISECRGEVDAYYAHPSRDFAATDEALRIRRSAGRNALTYKGPKIDRTTKTRREIDLPLPAEGEDVARWEQLLAALGFTPVAEVRKQRRKAFVQWEDRRIEVSLDDVAEVGTFVELELIAGDENADENADEDLESAKARIASLAAKLGLHGSQRKSYLELLLEGRAG